MYYNVSSGQILIRVSPWTDLDVFSFLRQHQQSQTLQPATYVDRIYIKKYKLAKNAKDYKNNITKKMQKSYIKWLG